MSIIAPRRVSSSDSLLLPVSYSFVSSFALVPCLSLLPLSWSLYPELESNGSSRQLPMLPKRSCLKPFLALVRESCFDLILSWCKDWPGVILTIRRWWTMVASVGSSAYDPQKKLKHYVYSWWFRIWLGLRVVQWKMAYGIPVQSRTADCNVVFFTSSLLRSFSVNDEWLVGWWLALWWMFRETQGSRPFCAKQTQGFITNLQEAFNF